MDPIQMNDDKRYVLNLKKKLIRLCSYTNKRRISVLLFVGGLYVLSVQGPVKPVTRPAYILFLYVILELFRDRYVLYVNSLIYFKAIACICFILFIQQKIIISIYKYTSKTGSFAA